MIGKKVLLFNKFSDEKTGNTEEKTGRVTDDRNVLAKTKFPKEKGKYNLSLNLAFQIAKALKSNVDELFIFEEEKKR